VSGEAPVRWPARFYWWIDAVGGFLVLTRPVVRIGQIGRVGNDLEILGNLSGNHAEFRRADGAWMLIAHAETTVNDQPGNTFFLKHGDRIKLRDVELTFRQPVPFSTTARLDFGPKHRLKQALDGVILLGNTCRLANEPDAHIRTRWPQPVFLSQYRDGWWLKAMAPFEIDGKPCASHGELNPTADVRAKWGSFRLEPVPEESKAAAAAS
jgi:hypothetical protein